ncbi:hypothetical protein TNCV_634471 [Trichonephila clavipes]|nr:hypothetical protein TNCV_634471 [Trichonephila clavipes]
MQQVLDRLLERRGETEAGLAAASVVNGFGNSIHKLVSYCLPKSHLLDLRFNSILESSRINLVRQVRDSIVSSGASLVL